MYIGVLASAAAFFLRNRGGADLGPQRTAQFMYFMPVFGALLPVFFLGEPPQGYQLAGEPVVLTGLWLAHPAGSTGTTVQATSLTRMRHIKCAFQSPRPAPSRWPGTGLSPPVC